MLSVTLALMVVSSIALLFPTTRGTGLVLTAILFSFHPFIYTAVLLVGCGLYLFLRFRN